mgnify:CR=1 FL=1
MKMTLHKDIWRFTARVSNKINLLVIKSSDINSVNTWSGIPYHIVHYLKKSEVFYVKVLSPIFDPFSRYSYLLDSLLRKLFKKRIDLEVSFFAAFYFSVYLKIWLMFQKNRYDYILSIGHGTEIAMLKVEIPILSVVDCSLVSLFDYYHEYDDLFSYRRREIASIEDRHFMNSTVILTASEWAASEIHRIHGIKKEKIHFCNFGANLKKIPEVDLNKKLSDNRCRFLFIGKDWERKGGQHAFEIVERLNGRGVPSELHVCGCSPSIKSENVVVHNFLQKDKEEDILRLYELLNKAHFFLFLSRAECYGIAMVEAAAFGVPIIAYRTGGIPSVVTTDINGLLVEKRSDTEKILSFIEHYWIDKAQYSKLVQRTRLDFEQRLSWTSWCRNLNEILSEKDKTGSIELRAAFISAN